MKLTDAEPWELSLFAAAALLAVVYGMRRLALADRSVLFCPVRRTAAYGGLCLLGLAGLVAGATVYAGLRNP
jgi:hypothetical protein